MSLKESINKTESLKNNVRAAKDRINSKLTSLGGSSANTLADVPAKIESSVGTLHHFAEGSLNISTGTGKQFSFDLPVDFNVKYLILTITTNGGTYISKYLFDFSNTAEYGNYVAAYPRLQYARMDLSKKGSHFDGGTYAFSGGATFSIIHWVALG